MKKIRFVLTCLLLVVSVAAFAQNVQVKGKVVDAKSILRLMSIGLRRGDKVTILASGTDAQRAVDELAALIDSRFGETD